MAAGAESAENEEDNIPSEIEISEDLALFINLKIQEDPSFIDKLTHYGQAKITLDTLLALHVIPMSRVV